MSDTILAAEGLTVRFGAGERAVTALTDFGLDLRRGETVGIIGRSGSGKSTASRAMLRLLSDDAQVTGNVTFEGQDLLSLPERRFRRLRWEQLALVPQAAMNSLDPVLRVDQQIAEVVRAHRHTGRRQAIAMAREALERVGISPNRASSFPHQFSGGMRQRALIAMARVLEPTVLVADEPTTGLDVVVQDRILGLLEDSKRELGLSMILVTHDLGVAAELCDRLIVLEEGHVVEAGSPAQVLGHRAHTAPVVKVEPASAPGAAVAPANHDMALVTHHMEVSHTSGRGLATLRRTSELKVLEDVSLELRRGEVLGLAGESGCGKSSLLSSLVGLHGVSGGTIDISGHHFDSHGTEDWYDLRRHVQMIFQDPYDSLNPRFTVERAVTEPLLTMQSRGQRLSRAGIHDRVVAALEAAGLKPPERYLGRHTFRLSGGERQRVAIARALVLDPAVLLADEPVSMLDESTAHEVVALLHGLTRQLDVAVLLVSHDVSLLGEVCDNIAIMYLGRIVEYGPAESVLRSPQHPYARALVQAIPSKDPATRRTRVSLQGEPPSLVSRPSGCPFHPRCPAATALCAETVPVLEGDVHQVACWHPSELLLPVSIGRRPASSRTAGDQ